MGPRPEILGRDDVAVVARPHANRLEQLNGQAVYTFDANGNLLNSDTLTNTFDAAKRLVSTTRDEATVVPIYNGPRSASG